VQSLLGKTGSQSITVLCSITFETAGEHVINSSINTTQVNLDGLLEVLGKNLYSTPAVALRELVQNAHDACQRRTIEDHDDDREYSIHLECNAELSVLEISDNGSGLTRDEINEYLATIGSGYTRVLREPDGADSAHQLIGYFGLGFLSAYVVSSKVQVVTTSYQTPEQTWSFSSAGGKTFTVDQSENAPIGTRVRLQLSSKFFALADTQVVSALLARYCSLLPIPITLNARPERINSLLPPWRLDPQVPVVKKRKAELEFAQVFENDFTPITCYTLPSDNPYQLKGMLWIQDGSSYLSSDNRNVSVFIRGMFISNDELDLLPRWAGFMGGVFESALFQPTASRESLQKDDYYEDVVDYICEQLVTNLRDTVLREPNTWQRILEGHGQALLGASISDDRLFDIMRKSLKVPTVDGEMTMSQLLRRSHQCIYIKPETSASFEDVLFKAQSIPLVQGYMYAAMAFCQKFSEVENIPVKILGRERDTESLFSPCDNPPEILRSLFREAYPEGDYDLVFSLFSPVHIPLVMMPNRDAILKNRLEKKDLDKRVGAAALSLARIHTKKIKQATENIIFVNLSNDIIQRLEHLSPLMQGQIITLLKSLMVIASGLDTGGSLSVNDAFLQLNSTILTLIEKD